ncbi:MAG TPA: hypothetical protein DD761_17080 [Cyanobacteria bacterium UBA11691]|nr:hypothetical protein [Cyanobacteria bacterium UBA11691]
MAIKKLKEYLQSLYQDNLDKVILFGSEARGEADIDSDIAILIVLKTPFVYVVFSPYHSAKHCIFEFLVDSRLPS